VIKPAATSPADRPASIVAAFTSLQMSQPERIGGRESLDLLTTVAAKERDGDA
jgi:hypothetical protein